MFLYLIQTLWMRLMAVVNCTLHSIGGNLWGSRVRKERWRFFSVCDVIKSLSSHQIALQDWQWGQKQTPQAQKQECGLTEHHHPFVERDTFLHIVRQYDRAEGKREDVGGRVCVSRERRGEGEREREGREQRKRQERKEWEREREIREFWNIYRRLETDVKK